MNQPDNDNKLVKKNLSDFSMDHILNRAGQNNNHSKVGESSSDEFNTESTFNLNSFPWLQCSRYCPPKIPRTHRTHRKDGPQKRQLGRHPRIPFTSQQLDILEEKFQKCPYLSSEEVIALSKKLHLADIRVKIWFQNRRARERRERTSHNNNQEIFAQMNEESDSSDNLSIANENIKNSLTEPSTSTASTNPIVYQFSIHPTTGKLPYPNYLDYLPRCIQNNQNSSPTNSE